jgi:hypothetical protein
MSGESGRAEVHSRRAWDGIYALLNLAVLGAGVWLLAGGWGFRFPAPGFAGIILGIAVLFVLEGLLLEGAGSWHRSLGAVIFQSVVYFLLYIGSLEGECPYPGYVFSLGFALSIFTFGHLVRPDIQKMRGVSRDRRADLSGGENED